MFCQTDGSHFRLYDPANDPAPIREPGKSDKTVIVPPIDQTGDEGDETASTASAYESDLRNFLSVKPSTNSTPRRLSQELAALY